MKPKTSPFARTIRTTALFTAITFCVAGHTQAADFVWSGTTGDFNSAANWTISGSPAGAVPAAADTASVANGGTAQYNANTAKTVLELRAGYGGAGSVEISGGSTFTSSSSIQAGRQTGTGTGSLTVSGTGTLLSINSGTTLVGASSADIGTVGSGTIGVLNINSGATYTHLPAADDSFRIGDNTLAQTGSYKGTLNVNGGTLNLPAGSRLYVAQSAGSVGEVNVTNNGTINVNDDWIVIGRGGMGKLTLTSGTITKAGANNFAAGDSAGTGVVEHTGGTLAINNGEFFVGNGVNATGTYNLGTGATVSVANWSVIGRDGGNGTFIMSGGTFNKTGGGNFSVANGGNSTGQATHTGGDLNITGGEFFVGNGNGSNAIYDLGNAGNVTVNSWIAVGRERSNGTLNITGGTLTKNGATDTHFIIASGDNTNQGILNLSGGLVNITAGELWVGEGSNGAANISSNGELRASAVQVAKNNTIHPGTLRLNGGTLRTSRIYGGAGVSTVEFNSGLIQATANQTNFLDNIDTADIKSGGAVIDTNGFNIGIGNADTTGQILTGTGGLTKNGTGTLTLPTANTYSGPTIVNAGRLVTTTGSLATGAVTVADSATLGLNILGGGQMIQTSALTLGQSSIDLNAGPGGNPIVAPIQVNGTLALNGTAASASINLTGSNFSVGQFPLISYTSLAGTGGYPSLKIGTLPLGVTAVLVNNTASNSIDINITRINTPTWTGANNANWNTITENWIDEVSGLPTLFTNGDPVSFQDGASVFAVQLPGTVIPGGTVTFNNSLDNYTLTGSGKISGTTSLIKRGVASVTINTVNNDHTGLTHIEGGSLIVSTLPNGGVAGPLGASTSAAANLQLAGGTLSYSGATAASNRGFSVTAAEGSIEVSNALTNLTFSGPVVTTAGGLVKKGPGTLTLTSAGANAIAIGVAARVDGGKLVLNGTTTSPAQIISSGELWIGSTPASGGAMDIINSTVSNNSWLAIGRGNGDGGNISTLNLTNSTLNVVNISTGFNNGLPNLATQEINLANSTLTNTGTTLIAENRGSTTNIVLTGGSVLNTRELLMGLGGGPALGATSATLTVGGTSTVNVGSETILSYVSIGRDGGTGNLIVKENGSFLNYDDFTLGEVANNGGTGTVTLQDSGVITVRTPLLGRGVTNNALINQTGGTFSNRGDNNFQIGVFGNATYNLSAGTVNANGWNAIGRYSSSTASLNLSGGTFNQTAADRGILVGEEGNGTLAVSATGQLLANGSFRVGWAGTGIGTVTQTGGLISVGQNVLLGENGTANVTLSGGQFRMNTNGTVNFIVGNYGNGQATLNISGSADVRLMNNASLRLGNESSTATNTVNQTGGTVTTYSDNGTTVGGSGILVIGRAAATGLNTYNLAGGTLTIGAVTREAANSTSILNFNGGTLKATKDNTAFVTNLTQVGIQSGGAIIDTNTHNVTVTNGLVNASATGGLTKTGAGTLTLAGPNTYLGDTAVSAGTLTLADNASLRFLVGANGVSNRITGTGSAFLDGDFNLELGSAAIANGNSWTLVSGSVVESYGANFNVVGFTKSGSVWTQSLGGNTWTYSEVTGALTLTTGTASGYSSWASTYGLGAGSEQGDGDNDGIRNLMEYVLGGIPNSANTSILPTQTLDATNLVLTFRRSDLSEADATVKVQWSSNLATWTDFATIGAVSSLPAVQVTENSPNADLDTIQVTIPRSGRESGGKLFGRVQAVK
jgi:fibronectin-binding autotransporter adhesin